MGGHIIFTPAIHTCGGPPTGGCASAKFSTHGMSYSQVCGRLRGYQIGVPSAFGPYVNNPTSGVIIDGALISHGKTHKHIWVYAVGYERVPIDRGYNNHFCPCASYRFNGIVPLEMTIIVIVELTVTLKLESSTLHHCGLVKDVLHQITAAPIVECHGSVRLYPFPLLTTLRYIIVITR